VKTTHLAAALCLAALAAACTPAPSAPPKPALKTDDDKTIYVIGLAIQKSLEPFQLTPAELDMVFAGIRDGAAGKPELALESKQQDIQKLLTTRRAAQGAAAVKRGEEYLAKSAKEAGAVKTPSGLVYIPIKEGGGASPVATDTVKVNYKGQLPDGKVFDASEKHGGPATFGLNGVIPCWTEGVQKMKVGGKARLVCPSAIAYGDRGAGGDVPPGAVLDFEVELLEIVKGK